MDLCVRFLGLELLTVHVSTDAHAAVEYDEPGECVTTPIGFQVAHEIPDQAGPFREGWE